MARHFCRSQCIHLLARLIGWTCRTCEMFSDSVDRTVAWNGVLLSCLAHITSTSDYDVKFQSALFCASKSCVIFRERKNALFLQFGNWQFYLMCRQLTYFDSGYVSRETRLESVLISLFLCTRNFWAENVWNNLNLLVKALTFLNQLRFYQVFIWCKQEI